MIEDGREPQSPEAERAVLGSILLDPAALDRVKPILSAADFCSIVNRNIYGVMLDLSARSVGIDLITLRQSLNGAEGASAAYISSLMSATPDIGNIEHYARIVKGKATRRRLIDAGLRIARAGPSEDKEISALIAEAQAEIEQLAVVGDARPPLKPITAAALGELSIPPRRLILVPWWGDGEQPVVWGWRGVGKSWITLGCAGTIAAAGSFLGWKAPAPLRVLFVDGEMMSRRLQERLRILHESCGLDPEKLGANLFILTPDLLGRILNLWKAEDRAAVERLAAELDVQVIVFDNIAALYRTDSPKLTSNLAEWWEPFQTWLLGFRARGVATLTAVHSGKDETRGPRSTSAIEDLIEISIKVSEAKGRKPTDGAWFEVEFTKARDYLGPGGEKTEARLEGNAWTICGEEAARARAKEEQKARQRKKIDELAELAGDFLRSNPKASERQVAGGLRAAGHTFNDKDLRAALQRIRQPSTVDDSGRPGFLEVDE